MSNLGNLAYSYDNGNRRIETTGSFAGVALPGSTADLMVGTGTMTYYQDNSPKTYSPTKPANYNNVKTLNIAADSDGNVDVEGTNSGAIFPYAQFVWSARGVPKTIQQGGSIEQVMYDPFGRRTNLNFTPLTGTASSTNYLYDGQNVVEEQFVTSGGYARVINGIGLDERYIRVNASGVASYFVTDGHGLDHRAAANFPGDLFR